jgi:hypothetical protein
VRLPPPTPTGPHRIPDWWVLKAVLRPKYTLVLTKGELAKNMAETEWLEKFTQDESFSYDALLRSAITRESWGYFFSDYPHCEDCIDTFIQSSLHLWLLDQKRRGACPTHGPAKLTGPARPPAGVMPKHRCPHDGRGSMYARTDQLCQGRLLLPAADTRL